MLHIYLKYASYWLHIWRKYGYEGDLTTLATGCCCKSATPITNSVVTSVTRYHSTMAWLHWLPGQHEDTCWAPAATSTQDLGPILANTNINIQIHNTHNKTQFEVKYSYFLKLLVWNATNDWIVAVCAKVICWTEDGRRKRCRWSISIETENVNVIFRLADFHNFSTFNKFLQTGDFFTINFYYFVT